jgi:hypothetical protein
MGKEREAVRDDESATRRTVQTERAAGERESVRWVRVHRSAAA